MIKTNKTLGEVLDCFHFETKISVFMEDNENPLKSGNASNIRWWLVGYEDNYVKEVTMSVEGFVIVISKKAKLIDGKEYYFKVIQSAEAESSGYVRMTLKEAKFMNSVADSDNWMFAELNPYSGSFRVDLEDWKTIVEVEGTNNEQN
jgi:hypothetical protein